MRVRTFRTKSPANEPINHTLPLMWVSLLVGLKAGRPAGRSVCWLAKNVQPISISDDSNQIPQKGDGGAVGDNGQPSVRRSAAAYHVRHKELCKYDEETAAAAKKLV